MSDRAQVETEVGRLRTELADARLTLAMVRGEGWPDGWTGRGPLARRVSPCRSYSITPSIINDEMVYHLTQTDQSNFGSFEPGHRSAYSDPLAALRAYQAMVTP